QYWGPKTGGLDKVSATQLDERGTMTDNGPAVGSVKWHMQAGPRIARASMTDGIVTVPSNQAYPFDPSVQASSNTELTVNGPGFEFNTSLNLHVDGYLDRPVCGGTGDCGSLSVFVNAPSGTTAARTAEFAASGFIRNNDLGLAFDPVGNRYHV